MFNLKLCNFKGNGNAASVCRMQEKPRGRFLKATMVASRNVTLNWNDSLNSRF